MKWWLVTWNTYASWLPGDPRGFQTWRGREYVPPPARYAKPGEKVYDPAEYAERYESAKAISGDAVTLTPDERRITADAVVAEVDKLHLPSAILAVGGQHCHLRAKFGALKIRATVGVLKSEATKAMRALGFHRDQYWATECHMKSKSEGKEFGDAFGYVGRHVDEGAVIYIWPAFRAMARS